MTPHALTRLFHRPLFRSANSVMSAPGSLAARGRAEAKAVLEPVTLTSWSGACAPNLCNRALDALEGGKIVFLPCLAFELTERERRFLNPATSDGKSKNISFDPHTRTVSGTSLSGSEREELAALLDRFGAQSHSLVATLFPQYRAHLSRGRASLRPARIGERKTSYRKDDTRLHTDAFSSQPVQGRRILRVFSNVDPAGTPRVWRVGEGFAVSAQRFLPRRPRALPGTATLLQALGITKGRRTAYDRMMLTLHDRAKADVEWQRTAVRAEFAFPAGSTWIVYTDRVIHAAITGQHALEQTFYLPIAAMADPEQSPLRILESRLGESLLY
jgi:hypothetical protein